MTAQPPHERRYLSHEEIEALYGAAPSDVEKVASFAAAHGLEVAEVNLQGRLVVLEGPHERLAEAFQCEIEAVQRGPNQHFRAGAAELPAELQGIVENVFGLDNLPRFNRGEHTRHALRKDPAATPDGAPPASTENLDASTPEEIIRRYRFPATTGKGQTIAILLLGGGFYEEDIRQYFGDRMPRLDVVEVGGATNDPAPRKAVQQYFEALEKHQDPNVSSELSSQIWWTLEATVDIELAGSFAPDAHLVVYFAPNEERGKIEGVTAVLTDRENDPSLLSCSWGISEADIDDAYVQSLEGVLQRAVLQGVSVCYSSGDSGADVADGKPSAQYPASSPFVLGCGGTTLPQTPDKPEFAWNESRGTRVLATGGGFSRFFARPKWQRGVPDSPDGKAQRGVPDVAGKADFATGYEIFLVGRRWKLGGGTSSATPMWAGLLARFNQALGSRLGWVTPHFYRPEMAGKLTDIVDGNNGMYEAIPGWDATTGWGAPDGQALLQGLEALPKISSPTEVSSK